MKTLHTSLKTSLKALFALLIFIIGLLAVATLLLATPQGTAPVFNVVNYWLPKSISLGTISGSLFYKGELNNFYVKQKDNFVKIDHLSWQWQPTNPLPGRFVLSDITLEGLHIKWHSQKESHSLKHLLKFYRDHLSFFSAQVKKGTLKNLTLTDEAGITMTLVETATITNALLTPTDLYAPNWQMETTPIQMQAATHFHFNPFISVQHHGTIKVKLPATLPDIKLDVQLQGDLKNLFVFSNSHTPYPTTVKIKIDDINYNKKISGNFELSPFTFSAIYPHMLPYPLTVKGKIAGTSQQPNIDIQAQLSKTPMGTFNAQSHIRWQPKLLSFDKLQFSHPESGLKAQGQGKINLQPPYRWDAQFTWKNLSWPLKSTKKILSQSSGQVQIKGHQKNYTLYAQSNTQWQSLKNVLIKLTGQGDQQHFTISQLQTTSPLGQIHANGFLQWLPTFKLTSQIHGEKINLAALPSEKTKSWPSQLNGTVKFNMENFHEFSLQDLLLQGSLKQLPIQINSQMAYQNNLIKIQSLQAKLADSQLAAQGQANEKQVNLSLALKAQHIQQWLDNAAGDLQINAQLQGFWSSPVVLAQWQGQSLQWHDFYADQFNGSIHSIPHQIQKDFISSTIKSARIHHTDIRYLEFNAGGNLEHHTFNVSIDSPTLTADGQGQGQWQPENQQWHFSLDQAHWTPASLPTWTLNKTLTGMISPALQIISPHCWSWSEHQLCAELEKNPSVFTTQISLNALPLAYFDTLFPTHVQPTGDVSGILDWQQKTNESPDFNLLLATSAGHLYDTTEHSNTVSNANTLYFNPSTLSIHGKDASISSHLLLDLGTQGISQIHMIFPTLNANPIQWRTTPIEGRYQLNLNQLAFLTEWTPYVEIVAGQWHSDFSISGTLDKPKIAGQGVLENGHILLEGPEIELTQVTATVNNIGDQSLSTQITAHAGEGAIAANSQIFFSQQMLRMISHIQGENATLMNTKEFHIIASPQLDVTLDHQQIDVRGKIDIPQAELAPKNLRDAQGVAPSEDQTIVSSDTAQLNTSTKKTKLNIKGEITLSLGDKVFFEGFGLKSQLDGNLRITQRLQEKPLASGQIIITQGRYTAYGQDLEIQNGRLLFAGGPIDQPGIDLKAVRAIDDTLQVGVNAKGSLEKPVFSTFSTQSLSQSEQLSYLILGTPLDESAQGENNTLIRAALNLGLQQSGGLTKALTERTGLDEISINTSTASTTNSNTNTNNTTASSSNNAAIQQAALSIGKYLSPKLYISYGIGFPEPISTFKVRYRIDRHWRFNTENSAKYSSGDLIYEIERGK